MREDDRIPIGARDLASSAERLTSNLCFEHMRVLTCLLERIFDLDDSIGLPPIPSAPLVLVVNLAALDFEDQEARLRMNDYEVCFTFSERHLAAEIGSHAQSPRAG